MLERARSWADLPGADAWDAALTWADLTAVAWAAVPPIGDGLADLELDPLDLELDAAHPDATDPLELDADPIASARLDAADLERLGVRAGRLADLDLPLRALVGLDLTP